MAGDHLNFIITDQQVNGLWALASLYAPKIREGDKMFVQSSAIWATVLILTLMKYSNQWDECELIAMKAKSWVRKPSLSSGLTIKECC